MSERKQTARRDAQNRSKAHGRKASKPMRRIVVIVDGERYDNLARVAQAMNSAPWCTNDNTAESVFDWFVWPLAEDYLDSLQEMCDSILHGIATGENGEDMPEPVHSKRIEELRAAFVGAGLMK